MNKIALYKAQEQYENNPEQYIMEYDYEEKEELTLKQKIRERKVDEADSY